MSETAPIILETIFYCDCDKEWTVKVAVADKMECPNCKKNMKEMGWAEVGMDKKK